MSEGTNSAATRRSYNKRERGDVIERNEGERETRLDSTKSSPTTVPLRLFFFSSSSLLSLRLFSLLFLLPLSPKKGGGKLVCQCMRIDGSSCVH